MALSSLAFASYCPSVCFFPYMMFSIAHTFLTVLLDQCFTSLSALLLKKGLTFFQGRLKATYYLQKPQVAQNLFYFYYSFPLSVLCLGCFLGAIMLSCPRKKTCWFLWLHLPFTSGQHVFFVCVHSSRTPV